MEKTSVRPITKLLLIAFCGVLWLIGFTYDTGYGIGYDILGKTKILVLALFLFCIVIYHKKYNFSLGSVFVAFMLVYMILINETRNNRSIENYIWVWLLIPVLKLFPVQKAQFKLIGFAYGIATIGVLLIGNVTGIFSGWDGNSVSIMQFFSYTVFMASLSDTKDKKNIRRIILYSAVYLYLLNAFESRSAQLFSVIMLLCMLSIIPFRKFYGKPLILLALLLPMIIAVVIVLVKDLPVVEVVNDWSYDIFNKPIFNGRDFIWGMGFDTWKKAPFIGNGNLAQYSYHNSAITCLVGAGIIGYAILIGVCYKILSGAIKWINDSIVYGLATAFLIIWMQQSVELGLITSAPNVIPYMILGLLYARINTLESENDGEGVYNNTNI